MKNATKRLRRANIEHASELKEQEDEMQRQLDQLRAGSTESPEENSLTAEDVAEILSMWTGIPIYQFTEEESARLLRMEEEMRKSHRRSGRSHHGHLQGRPPRPRRPEGPAPSDRLLHLPRPDGRR